MLLIIIKRFMYIFLSLPFFFSELLANEKFRVDNNILYYSTNNAKEEIDQEISWDDVEVFEAILKENHNINMLVLDSVGGIVEAAMYLADVTIDYELDTNVDGECLSACVFIFLGGNNRFLERGSWIGFHKSNWASNSLKEYYEENKEYYGWSDEYKFAEWLHEDTQKYILGSLEYLIERGVDPEFAIKTLRADSDDMWYPRRKELLEVGIINQINETLIKEGY